MDTSLHMPTAATEAKSEAAHVKRRGSTENVIGKTAGAHVALHKLRQGHAQTRAKRNHAQLHTVHQSCITRVLLLDVMLPEDQASYLTHATTISYLSYAAFSGTQTSSTSSASNSCTRCQYFSVSVSSAVWSGYRSFSAVNSDIVLQLICVKHLITTSRGLRAPRPGGPAAATRQQPPRPLALDQSGGLQIRLSHLMVRTFEHKQ